MHKKLIKNLAHFIDIKDASNYRINSTIIYFVDAYT